LPPVVIGNPIRNSPFREPTRHFRFGDDGVTSKIAEGRRRSTYFIRISAPRTKGGARLCLPGVRVGERRTGDFINRVCEHVSAFPGE
jgi:type III restriction enzyme